MDEDNLECYKGIDLVIFLLFIVGILVTVFISIWFIKLIIVKYFIGG